MGTPSSIEWPYSPGPHHRRRRAFADLPGSPEQPFVQRLQLRRAPLARVLDWLGLVSAAAGCWVLGACNQQQPAARMARGTKALPNSLPHSSSPRPPFMQTGCSAHLLAAAAAPACARPAGTPGPHAPPALWLRLCRPHPAAQRRRPRRALGPAARSWTAAWRLAAAVVRVGELQSRHLLRLRVLRFAACAAGAA